MIESEIEIVGDAEVAAKFSGMTEALRVRLRALFPQAGEEIRRAAASAAPRSPRRSTASKKYGPLHDAIKATFFERGDTFIESVSIGKAFYGRFFERGLDTTRRPRRARGIVGTRLRHLKGGGVAASPKRGLLQRQPGVSTPFHLAAHPFLRPAFLSRRDAILAKIRAAVAEAAA